MPHLKKAELIEGVVFVPSPLRLDHGLADSNLSFWLSTYYLATPFTQRAGNVTWFMLGSAPQPDLCLPGNDLHDSRVFDSAQFSGGDFTCFPASTGVF